MCHGRQINKAHVLFHGLSPICYRNWTERPLIGHSCWEPRTVNLFSAQIPPGASKTPWRWGGLLWTLCISYPGYPVAFSAFHFLLIGGHQIGPTPKQHLGKDSPLQSPLRCHKLVSDVKAIYLSKGVVLKHFWSPTLPPTQRCQIQYGGVLWSQSPMERMMK